MDPIAGLAERLPELPISRDPADLFAYSRDLWPRELIRLRGGASHTPPGAVVWPRSSDEIASLVRFAAAEGIALVPFGAGSGVCGGIAPTRHSVVVDLKRHATFRVDPEAPLLDCGPGALGMELERELERAGFTTGHFPSSILCSTVGGWVAARGAGQCSGRYGKIEDMVLGLECVLGTGEVVSLGRRSGPNLLPLMVGSEGTLGIISDVQLRLHRLPAQRTFHAYSFPDIEAGWGAIREMFQSGLRPAVCRLYDPIDSLILKQGSVKRRPMPRNPFAGLPPGNPTVRRSSELAGWLTRAGLQMPRALNRGIAALERTPLGRATLILVWEGTLEETRADAAAGEIIAARGGARPLGEGPARHWYAHRYSVSYRQSPVFRMGAFSDTMEVAASWANLSRVYAEIRAAISDHAVVMAHLSHAYPDGCSIYFTFAGRESRESASLSRYDRAWQAALESAISAGATISHHHGIGRSKRAYIEQELGGGAELLGLVSRVCDPAGIMNPGNLLPPSVRDAAGGVAPRGPSPEIKSPAVDALSGIVTVSAQHDLGRLESELAAQGFTLDLVGAPGQVTVGAWIEEGMTGSRDTLDDPVDHTLVALSGRTHRGHLMDLQPVPRRATGGDPQALFAGARGRLGRIERAALRIRRSAAPRARPLPFDGDRDSAVSASEEALWERLEAAD